MSRIQNLATATNNHWLSKVRRKPWPELSVLVIAAITRFWRLSYHSIWFDESVSLMWARSDPSYIWQVTFPLIEDKHPPLYYLLLHFWQQFLSVFGLASSDAALRASGAILGILTVAGLMLLAGRLAGRATALLAGLLAALAPLLVWYSQELRMFQPATTGVVWASCSLMYAWSAVDARRRYLWWAVFVLSMTAALYTYLFSAFMMPAAGFTLLILSYRRRSWRLFIEGAVALAIVTAVFLPLASNAWLVNSSESTPGQSFERFAANTASMIQSFTVWRIPWPDTLTTAVVVLYGLLFVIGLAAPYVRKADATKIWRLDLDQVWLIVWLVTPFLIANGMLARSGSIFDEERYLLFMAPFFLWAAARGVVSMAQRRRSLGWVAAALAVTPLLLALPNLWAPAMARENWRAAAEYILAYHEASPSLPDAVIAHVEYTHEPLEWYLRQDKTHQELPVFFPFGGVLSPEQIDDVIAPPLLGLVDFGTHTAWLTQSHLEGVDEQRLVEQWFEDNYPIVTEQYPAGVKLSAYALQHRFPELPQLAAKAVYPEAELAPGITLAACEVLQETVRARDELMHPPSGWVHVRLWWRADEASADDYRTSAQLVDENGVWGDRLARKGELMDKWPVSQWLPGEVVREDLDINLNPLTEPGSYAIQIGLINSDGETGPSVQCGSVEVR